jgi:photosystem II stability/assembly factor-like uncharacterized protein
MKWLALIVLISGCKISPLIYQCGSDTQCSGAGGRCVGGSCAFPSSSCATGLVFDPSAASGLGGQCVTSEQLNDSDLAMDTTNGDMGDGTLGDMAGPSPDLWMPPCVWTATNNLPENGSRIWAADASHLAVAGQTNLLVSNTSGLGWTGVPLRDMANTVVTPRALFATGSTFWAIGKGMNVWSIDDNTNTVTLDYQPAAANSVDISGIWGASASDLWTIGDGALPIHRVGTTWTLASASVAMGNDMFSMHGSSATNVWAAGDFYVTHWDGSSWTPQMLNVGGGSINSIWVRDLMNVYIVNGGGTYYATHDGGTNWGGGATGLTTGLAIYGFPGHLYLAGNGNKIAHSIDDGAHWTLEDVGFPMATPNINHVSGRSAHEVYVVAGTWWSICK